MFVLEVVRWSGVCVCVCAGGGGQYCSEGGGRAG